MILAAVLGLFSIGGGLGCLVNAPRVEQKLLGLLPPLGFLSGFVILPSAGIAIGYVPTLILEVASALAGGWLFNNASVWKVRAEADRLNAQQS